MAEKVSYKSIRDQLISLSVDIEDKAKICVLLERKIEDERIQLSNVESLISDNYKNVIEVRDLLCILIFVYLMGNHVVSRQSLKLTRKTQAIKQPLLSRSVFCLRRTHIRSIIFIFWNSL